MTIPKSGSQINKLPWWTWLVPILVIHLGSEFSALFKYAPGAAFYYLPTSIGIILINWWGPKRVIPAMYINAIVSAHLWDVGPWFLWPIYALPETIFISLSWYLFKFKGNGKYWLPDNRAFISFLVSGILLPLITEIFLLELVYILAGERSFNDFGYTFVRSALGEFISNFGITLPVLYFFTSGMQRKHLLLEPITIIREKHSLSNKQYMEIAFVCLLLIVLSETIPFEKYWFLYGIVSLSMAIRYGFSLAILTNLYIFLLTYIMPLVQNIITGNSQTLRSDVVDIYLGTSLLYVFSAVIGRVISDVGKAEKEIVTKVHQLEVANRELENTNKELDRFAYSVSHDLSAPLKSILGLTKISRITSSLADHRLYFDKIELCVQKLEVFISETLDYSRNKRKELELEMVNVKELCLDILDNLAYTEGFSNVKIEMNNLDNQSLQTDRIRLKMIINNILTNALKYQKQTENNQPLVSISSESKPGGLILSIKDNGEGIHPDIQKKIFNMFFRGHQGSNGSGLGLYIAKEAAKKIRSTISVKSEYGVGSTFTIDLKSLHK